jgi:hypothetical protein
MLKTVSAITNAIGALNYKGTWNANTNTPTLASGVGAKGDYYVVSVAGTTTLDGISNWGVGDWATFNGSVWQRVEGGADLNGVNLSVSGTTTLSALTASKAVFTDGSKNLSSTGTLGVDQGGTGVASITANRLPYGNGTSAVQTSANLTFDGTTLDVGASGVNSRFAVRAAAGGRAMFAQRSNGDNYFYTDNDNAVSTGANGADAVLFINKTTATNRSVNAAGTLNANGADYAEYMTKVDGCTFAKGDICGINANGKLTDKFKDSVSFIVKSTDPSFVGGNAWGSEESLGMSAPEPVMQAEDQSDEDFAPIKAKYDADKAAFDAVLEAARQKVDRVAFAGQVPVNITGATPGQYIVPVDDDGAIKPSAVDEASMTLGMYMRSVGKVIAIGQDGRAHIIVKVA